MVDPKRPSTSAQTPQRYHSAAPPPSVPPEGAEDSPTEKFARPSFADLTSTLRDVETSPALPPSIEVEFVQQKGRAAIPQAMWGMVDIYTQNRVYRVNAMLQCIEVIERLTGKSDPKHPMLGARMGGGQRREKGRVEIADPFPLPGMDIVFKQAGDKGGKFGHTSRVERVVLRVRVCAFKVDDTQPVWEEITSQFKLADLKARAKPTR